MSSVLGPHGSLPAEVPACRSGNRILLHMPLSGAISTTTALAAGNTGRERPSPSATGLLPSASLDCPRAHMRTRGTPDEQRPIVSLNLHFFFWRSTHTHLTLPSPPVQGIAIGMPVRGHGLKLPLSAYT